ncbi:glycosyltransferase [Polymorphobacter sp. PAMC 29334]|uniref:glycosyltransferase family 2 protein n=1 Tax=Polymorphobacter sp. PAMC 29334 TaxID=2862331 RepID=UPI001C766F63|nr:glycosyltransferase [Polymorphobacter sp. PAMC 29334]QYE35054.1 glycosyltransferase [Polymorphobacter sp. PAMC 29334]
MKAVSATMASADPVHRRDDPRVAAAPSIFIVVATKGRPGPTATLCQFLARQTVPIAAVHIVGSEAADVAGLAGCVPGLALDIVVAGAAGCSLQRNVALTSLFDRADAPADDDLIVFFDDDFRPADDWLERALGVMARSPDVVGLSGTVLGDGVCSDALSEQDAVDLIAGRLPPEAHWASGTSERPMAALYGCNMAVRARALRTERFDENLPLYSWQEDMDLAGRIVAQGRIIYTPDCRGVHLGSKSGRTSGVRFGYSQVANPIYLWRKGSVGPLRALRFAGRALLGNSVRSLREHRLFDYRGRFSGNLIALADLVRGRMDPRRILDL